MSLELRFLSARTWWPGDHESWWNWRQVIGAVWRVKRGRTPIPIYGLLTVASNLWWVVGGGWWEKTNW